MTELRKSLTRPAIVFAAILVGALVGPALGAGESYVIQPGDSITIAAAPCPVATPTLAPTATPTAAPTATPTPPPTPVPTVAPTPTPTVAPTPTSPPVAGNLPDLTRDYVDSLPKSGAAYSAVASAAGSTTRPDLANQDSKGNTNALARALLNDKAGVILDLKAAKASLSGVSRTLSLARELQPLPLAASLVGLTDADVGFSLDAFFLQAIEYGPIEGRDASTVRESARIDPTNWGSHSRATVMWVAWYLNDTALINEAYDNVSRYLNSGPGFNYHSDQVSWGIWTIAPTGTVRSGVDLDGAIHDIYRGGTFPHFGADGQNYVWEASQGTLSSMIAADMAEHPEVWALGDKAALRSLLWMTRTPAVGPATSDDTWQPYVTRAAYGAASPAVPATTSPGKGFGFTDWLYR